MTRTGKSTLAGLALIAAGFAFAPNAAHAQTATPVQKPLSLKIGAGFANSDTALDLGVSYDFGKTTATNPLLYQVYVDYYTKNSTNLFGYGVALKYLIGSPLTPTGHPYVGLGIGGYTASGGGDNSTKFGGKVFGGYQLNNGIFGEVDYAQTGFHSLNPVGVRIGYRF